tara:strand:+ start:15397 stop:15894 length:498 start_codon:yes stop_codon:yes gene_type:complete
MSNEMVLRLDSVEKRLLALEQTLIVMSRSISSAGNFLTRDEYISTKPPTTDSRSVTTTAINNNQAFAVMTKMTPKQHAVLQMLLRGSSNYEIAERFNVSENTVKIHVKSIMDKLGVRKRSLIVLNMRSAFNDIAEDQYEAMTTLSKRWDLDWNSKDRKVHKHLYK